MYTAQKGLVQPLEKFDRCSIVVAVSRAFVAW